MHYSLHLHVCCVTSCASLQYKSLAHEEQQRKLRLSPQVLRLTQLNSLPLNGVTLNRPQEMRKEEENTLLSTLHTHACFRSTLYTVHSAGLLHANPDKSLRNKIRLFRCMKWKKKKETFWSIFVLNKTVPVCNLIFFSIPVRMALHDEAQGIFQIFCPPAIAKTLGSSKQEIMAAPRTKSKTDCSLLLVYAPKV